MVNKFGIEFEANPIGKWLLQNDTRTIIYKVIIVCALLIVMYCTKEYKATKFASWVLFIAFILLTIYHIIGAIYVQKYI